MKYKKLFEKYYIGNLHLKNRVVMPPMATMLGSYETNHPTKAMVDYYEARAKGGVGLICIEHTCVTDPGLYGPGILKAFPETCIPHYKDLFDAIHKHGSKVVMQLGDGGTSAILDYNGGNETVSASSTPDHRIRLYPNEVTLEGIENYKKAYLHAVDNMVEAGVDAIMLHCANGYFLASFLSTRENKRTDKYGGTMEGRLRLPLEIISDIRRKYGNRVTLFARIGAFEDRDGRTVDETMVIAKALEEAGVEAISFNSGSYFELNYELPPYSQKPGYIMDHIAKLKKGLNIPVLGGGRVTEPLLADSYLRDNKVDLIEIGRGSMADSEWCNKAQSGNSDSIRRCIACCRCCEEKRLCSVNPQTFRESKIHISKVKKSQNILVIGGGIAGLQTSITLAQKGHKVTVVEKNSYLGGMAKAAAMPINKGEIVSLVTALAYDAKDFGVDIKLNTIADKEYVENMNPGVVVLATGAEAIKCSFIDGYEEAKFVDSIDLLMGNGIETIPIGANFAVIGGGAVGIETAEYLAVYENNVDVYEMEANLNSALFYNISNNYMLRNAKKHGVKVKLGCKVKSVKDGVISYEENGELKESKKYDYFISAVGLRSNNKLYEELSKAGFKTLLIGDAKNPSQFGEVLQEALDEANKIN